MLVLVGQGWQVECLLQEWIPFLKTIRELNFCIDS